MRVGYDYTGVAVIFCCHDGKGNFLLSKRGQGARDEQGVWEFGGGKLEFGETLEEAIKREMQEEYGCSALAIDALPPVSLVRKKENGTMHWVLIPSIVLVFTHYLFS